MATDLIMPRPPDQQHASFYPQLQGYPQPAPLQQAPVPVYPSQQQYHPTQVSPLSSANASPTSPRSYHGRQNRPLFMPAVLRPTEFPSKAPPQKPKAKADAVAENDDDRPMRSSGSFMSLPGLNSFGRLSRRSTDDPGNSMFGKWILDAFPVPRGAPSQQHWKPDASTVICDDTTCKRRFSTWTRRHHCRKCGNIFCDAHSAYQIPLDQDITFNPRASPVRACSHCYGEFKVWRSRTNSQVSSSASSEHQPHASMPSSPVVATPGATIGNFSAAMAGATPAPIAGAAAAVKTPEVAASVPRDWNWSTF